MWKRGDVLRFFNVNEALDFRGNFRYTENIFWGKTHFKVLDVEHASFSIKKIIKWVLKISSKKNKSMEV